LRAGDDLREGRYGQDVARAVAVFCVLPCLAPGREADAKGIAFLQLRAAFGEDDPGDHVPARRRSSMPSSRTQMVAGIPGPGP
jgi:hypothetical protein